MAGDGVGGEDCVGARAAHLILGALFGRAGGHVDLRIEELRRQQHEQVVGVGGQRAHQSFGARHAHTSPLARATPTATRVSSRVESAATASIPAAMAFSTRSWSISTTTNGTPACCNSDAAPRPTRPKPQITK